MKKYISILLLLAGTFNSQAQNVGIGTTNPAQKLDIDKGRLRFTGNPNAGTAQGIEFTDPAGTTLNGFVGTYNDSITGMYGFQGSNWSFVHNNKTGNIGLQGNVNPRTPLSFSNAVGNKISIYDNGDGTHYGIGLQAARMQFFVPAAAQDFVFGTGSSSSFVEKMRIKGNGNVGIGSNSPTATLQVVRGTGVNGTAEFDGTVNASHFNYGTAEDTYIRGGKATSQVLINDQSSGNVRLAEGGGSVGVGVAVPAATLDIAGNVKIADGTQGTGKVLTSDADGVASWQNIAYGNTERFQFGLYITDINTNGLLTTNYNLGTAVASQTAGNQFFTVRLPTAGLYHFDANCYISITGNYSSTGDGKTVDFLAYNTSTSTNIEKVFCPYIYYASDNTSRANGKISMDIYVPSNQTLRFSVSQFQNGGFEKRITVIGHKIAD